MQPGTGAPGQEGRAPLTKPLRGEEVAAVLGRLVREHPPGAAPPPDEWKDRLRFCQQMCLAGQVACGVAHDLNNLLTVLVGFSTCQLDALPEHDPRREAAEGIKRAANQAAALARRLLDLSRPPADPRPINPNTLLLELEQMLRSLLPPGVALVLDLEPTLGLVEAEPGGLEQVVLNLVLNARDALPRGGRVTLTTGECRVGPSRPDPGLPPGEYVTLAVRDTGCGMDAATRERIFEPFFTTKPAGRGTGLGLAIAAEVVGRCRGRFQVQSEPGRGTTFTLYLPRMPEAPPRPQREPTMAQPSPARETILVAEDHPSVRTLIDEVLRRGGYTALLAFNGPEALELCRGHPGDIALLITDLILPLMGGREVAEAVTRLRPGIKVLFISGYPAAEEFAAGTGFMQKPFYPEELLGRVRGLIGDGHDKT